MTREEAKEMLPIMQAFAEGKIIEFRTIEGTWEELPDPLFQNPYKYRIKPEPRYRPFKSQEECWQEMLKHQPFGWIIRDFDKEYINIVAVRDFNIYVVIAVLFKFSSDDNVHIVKCAVAEKCIGIVCLANS